MIFQRTLQDGAAAIYMAASDKYVAVGFVFAGPPFCFCDPLQADGRERPKSDGGLHMLSRAVIEKCDTHRRTERRLPDSLECCAFWKTRFLTCATVAGGRSNHFQICCRVAILVERMFGNLRPLHTDSTPHFHIRGRVVEFEEKACFASQSILKGKYGFGWEVSFF